MTSANIGKDIFVAIVLAAANFIKVFSREYSIIFVYSALSRQASLSILPSLTPVCRILSTIRRM